MEAEEDFDMAKGEDESHDYATMAAALEGDDGSDADESSSDDEGEEDDGFEAAFGSSGALKASDLSFLPGISFLKINLYLHLLVEAIHHRGCQRRCPPLLQEGAWSNAGFRQRC